MLMCSNLASMNTDTRQCGNERGRASGTQPRWLATATHTLAWPSRTGLPGLANPIAYARSALLFAIALDLITSLIPYMLLGVMMSGPVVGGAIGMLNGLSVWGIAWSCITCGAIASWAALAVLLRSSTLSPTQGHVVVRASCYACIWFVLAPIPIVGPLQATTMWLVWVFLGVRPHCDPRRVMLVCAAASGPWWGAVAWFVYRW